MSGPAVPWNASWSSEEEYEIRPCRWASGKRAVWQKHSPGIGRPQFAKPHMVRQRRSIAELRCTVCGEKTPADDRWWFQLGRIQDGYFMTTEAPVHRVCADYALTVCPHLKKEGGQLERMPTGFSILSAVLGNDPSKPSFKFDLSSHPIGNLKIAWPASLVKIQGPR